MKQHGIFNLLWNSVLLGALFIFCVIAFTPPITVLAQPSGQCADGIDNNKDNKADYYGIDLGTDTDNDGVIDDPKKDGIIDIEPDPSCFSPSATVEESDSVESTIIPCTNKCTFTDVFKLINNIIVFAIKNLLLPLFVLLIMYSGYKYLVSQGNPVKIAGFKRIIKNIILGVLLILCAWLIVVTGLRAIGYTDTLFFFDTIN